MRMKLDGYVKESTWVNVVLIRRKSDRYVGEIVIRWEIRWWGCNTTVKWEIWWWCEWYDGVVVIGVRDSCREWSEKFQSARVIVKLFNQFTL